MNWRFNASRRREPDDISANDGSVSRKVGDDAFDAPLEQAFDRALQDPTRIGQFNEAVCAFTQAHKDNGEPIERVLVHLKERIAHARAVSWEIGNYENELDSAHGLTDGAVRRCIEHFYDTPRGSAIARDTNAAQ